MGELRPRGVGGRSGRQQLLRTRGIRPLPRGIKLYRRGHSNPLHRSVAPARCSFFTLLRNTSRQQPPIEVINVQTTHNPNTFRARSLIDAQASSLAGLGDFVPCLFLWRVRCSEGGVWCLGVVVCWAGGVCVEPCLFFDKTGGGCDRMGVACVTGGMGGSVDAIVACCRSSARRFDSLRPISA